MPRRPSAAAAVKTAAISAWSPGFRARLEEVGANFQWHEVNAQHAFLRDEGPRYDPALAFHCYGLVMELFHRRLGPGDLTD